MSSSLQTLAQRLGVILKFHQWKLVTTESCTGGGLGYWITSVPGSSDWYDRGFITYSDEAKNEMIEVDKVLLEKFGAVSEQVAHEMAQKSLLHSRAQISIAITGVAGPAGGSTEKPVGTVWIAWAGIDSKTIVEHHIFHGDRQSVREQAITTALTGLIDLIKQWKTT